MMKKVLMTAVAAMALTTPAWAQVSVDADGSGSVSLEELQAVNPEITAEAFATIDSDGDGALNEDEFAAAQTAGLLTPAAPAADAGAAVAE